MRHDPDRQTQTDLETKTVKLLILEGSQMIGLHSSVYKPQILSQNTVINTIQHSLRLGFRVRVRVRIRVRVRVRVTCIAIFPYHKSERMERVREIRGGLLGACGSKGREMPLREQP